MNDHLVDTVDEQDQIIGQADKKLKAELGYISRVTAIILSDKHNRLIICKRAPHKKFSPNLYDLSAVGAVMAGESYETAAHRELQEELGLDCPLRLLDKFYQEAESVADGGKLKYFCAVFWGQTDTVPKLNEELSAIRKISLVELKNEIIASPELFCPGFLNDYRQVETQLAEILTE